VNHQSAASPSFSYVEYLSANESDMLLYTACLCMHASRYSSAQFLLDAGAAMDLKVAPSTAKCSTAASHQPSVTRHRHRRCIAGSCLCAIHFAAYHCRASVVRLLVEQGADVQVLDGRGRQAGAVFSAASALRWSCSSDRRLVSHLSACYFKCS
jgi:hypothetical protein